MIVISVLVALLRVYSIILFIRVLLTWFPNIDYNNPFVKFLHQVTEPVLEPVRRVLPPYRGWDFSALVVLVAISLISNVLLRF
jgi:YggT family protein